MGISFWLLAVGRWLVHFGCWPIVNVQICKCANGALGKEPRPIGEIGLAG